MSGGQDFSEDITNGGFASDEVELHHNEGDEDMVMGADGDLSAMNQDDSMQGASGSEIAGANGDGHGDEGKEGNQEGMEHSLDHHGAGGNADQFLGAQLLGT
ncbi:unnamed protein product [Orchesella dallaii]|uniref:Uncharacterized protein n=1 Tax=Orchesella dallaii TaxID=48710 RepID=A0ABP1QPL6_9HEXA